VAETFLGYSHAHSTLTESLLTSHITLDARTRIPSSIENHIEAIKKFESSSTLQDHYKHQLLQGLCLGFSPDLDWDRLPENIRKYLIQRCLGQSNSPSGTQETYLRSVLHEEPDLDIRSFIARCDYAAFMAVLCYNRANLSSPEQSEQSLQESSLLNGELPIVSANRIEHSSSNSKKRSFSTMLHQLFGYVYHRIGTGCKFFIVAFVADAEYQRELDYIVSGSPMITTKILVYFLNSIWILSKTIQRLLLPFFLVSQIP
jgi:hypothetical protein